MRPILSLGFLIALCASANAATGHYHSRKYAVTRPGYSIVIMSPVPYGAYAGPYGAYAGPRPPIYFDDQPGSLADSPYKNWGG